MMNKVRFSIITVCYNAEKCIKKTVLSVLKQDFNDYEYIIKDGNSTDETLRTVYSLLDGNERASIISQNDQGIYDAMNEAVKLARGEYIFFLNAGDCFCNKEMLSKVDIFLKNNKADVAYGNIIQIEGEQRQIRRYGKMYQKKMFYLTGDCICHQAMFAKRDLFKKEFDLKFKVCADREWQLYWLSNNASFLPMSFEVAEVLVDGFSKAHLKEFEEEVRECINLHLPKVAWIYSIVETMKRSKVLLKLLKAVEGVLFVK